MAIYKSDIVDVELENGNIDRSFLKHSIGSGDSDANRFGVRAFRGGVPQDLTGASIQGIFMNAAGVNIALASYGTVDGNVAYVTLPQACYNVEGQFTLALKLVQSGVTVTGRIVDGVVDNTGTTGAVVPTESVPTYQEIIAQYDAMVAATEAAQAAADLVAVADEFDMATAYSAGKYLLNEGALYRLTEDHEANVAWSSTSKVEVNLGDEVTLLNAATEDLPEIRANITALQKDTTILRTGVRDLTYYNGETEMSKITLIGDVVNYRYQRGNRTNTQTSMRYTLPKHVKTVDISMHALKNMNSYTFLDENDNVLTYLYETTEADVNYTNIPAWEATYLVCSNNTANRETITVKANIEGAAPYIDEAKKASDVTYTLLDGTPKDSYYSMMEEIEGNYSVEYTVSGYDYVEVSSFNVRDLNKYTMFDTNGNIISFFMNDVEADVGQQTTVRVAVPSNVVKMYVATYRNQRHNVVVYGITEPESFGWVNCAGTFADYVYQADVYYERENGSKEFAASPFDIFRLVDGTNAHANNAFTAFDSNDNVLGYVRFNDAGQQDICFIAPKGTVKVAVAGAVLNAGWGTCATMTIQKRKSNGTKLSVMGDSISSYLNFLPEGNAAYYEWGNRGVPSASYLWWGIVAREMGWTISTINSWSGSRVSNTASETSAMCMGRTANLAERGNPDVIIIYGGVNDYMQNVPLGTWAGRADIPITGTQFRTAYAMMLNKIHANYPLAKVYCCTLANLERDEVHGSLEHRPTGEITSDTQWLHEFNQAIREIAPIMNCTVIELESCGINQYNMETYMGDYNDSTGSGLHPNAEGHKLFAKRILNSLI